MVDVRTDRLKILVGNVLERLNDLPNDSVHCCVTSPPYWGLRDYGDVEQIGLEATTEEYVENIVRVFREVRRVLRPDGTLWLNLGDSFHNKQLQGIPWRVAFALRQDGWWLRSDIIWAKGISLDTRMGSCMPESVVDRPTSAHEHIFLLSPSERYFYDHEAIKEPTSGGAKGSRFDAGKTATHQQGRAQNGYRETGARGNIRNVWHTSPKPFPDAHFAVYPPNLIRPCIQAGTSQKGACVDCGAPWERIIERGGSTTDEDKVQEFMERGMDRNSASAYGTSGSYWRKAKEQNPDKFLGWQPTCDCDTDETTPCTVIDPFLGSGTTALVALEEGRNAVGIELNPDYVEIAKKRLSHLMNQARLDAWQY